MVLNLHTEASPDSTELMFLFTLTVLVVGNPFSRVNQCCARCRFAAKNCNWHIFIKQKLQTNCPKVKFTHEGIEDISSKNKANHM